MSQFPGMDGLFSFIAVALICAVPLIILFGAQRAIDQSARRRQQRHEEVLQAIRETNGQQGGTPPSKS